jgi:hypothetical protein
LRSCGSCTLNTYTELREYLRKFKGGKLMGKFEYVKEGGGYCLYCGSINVEGGQVDIERGIALQKIFCNDCQRSWTDKYFLVDVLEDEE